MLNIPKCVFLYVFHTIKIKCKNCIYIYINIYRIFVDLLKFKMLINIYEGIYKNTKK